MTQDELWKQNYRTFIDFMTTQKRRPSKHRLEEHQMLNWLKYQKKSLAQGKLKPERAKLLEELLSLSDQYLRKNQYSYAHTIPSDTLFGGNLFDRTD